MFLRFIQISDTHIGPSKDFLFQGVNAYNCASRLVETINALPFKPDFLIHTGDITNSPESECYAQAKEVLSKLKVPAYYATGNHDNADLINQYLSMGEKQMLPGADGLTYTFTKKGFRFIAIDARGPDAIDPHGLVSDSTLKAVERELYPDCPSTLFFTHFPILPLFSPWMDKHLRIINGEELHQLFIRAKDKIRGVFYGHIHHGIQSNKDGISYYSVGSGCFQFASWPNDEEVSFDPESPPSFNIVTLSENQIIIQQRVFCRP